MNSVYTIRHHTKPHKNNKHYSTRQSHNQPSRPASETKITMKNPRMTFLTATCTCPLYHATYANTFIFPGHVPDACTFSAQGECLFQPQKFWSEVVVEIFGISCDNLRKGGEIVGNVCGLMRYCRTDSYGVVCSSM